MAVLIDDTFDAGIAGWSNDSGSAPAHDTTLEDAALGSGCMAVAGNSQTTRTFTGITSGVARFDFWWRDDSTTVVASNNRNLNIYFLPSALSAISGNSAFYFGLSRNSGTVGATTIEGAYRNGAAFANVSPVFRRDGQAWWKIAAVVNVAARTYDLFVNDVLWLAGLDCPNTTFTDISKCVIRNGTEAGTPTMYVDDFRVESDYAPPVEATLVDHDFTGGSGAIEASTPATDDRNQHAQPWLVPAGTTADGYVLGAGGAAPDDAAKSCYAYRRCTVDGTIEVEFTSSATVGSSFLGVLARSFDAEAAALKIRYFGGSANRWAIFAGSTLLAAEASPSLSASTVYSVRVEMRGRVVAVSYKADTIASATAYTTVLTHTLTATDGSYIGQDRHGFWQGAAAAVADNLVRRFRFTGRAGDDEIAAASGGTTAVLERSAIPELYRSDCGLPARNLADGHGVQGTHRSLASMGRLTCATATIAAGTHVASYRQRGVMLGDAVFRGVGDQVTTFLRRGIWLAERCYCWGASGAGNLTQDADLPPALWSKAFRAVGASGAGSSYTHTVGDSWTTRVTNASNPPAAYQLVTALGTGDDLRLTTAVAAVQNAGIPNTVQSKLIGTGDAFTVAVVFAEGNLTDGQAIEVCRGVLLETGASIALDDTTLTRFRDDVGAPATIATFTSGSLKTDAPGDLNTDGFNERHGWYEVNQGATELAFTFPMGGLAQRFMPAFRLHGYTLGATPAVTIAGSPATAGTDYVIDDLGDGTAVLQLLSSPTSDTTIGLAGGAAEVLLPLLASTAALFAPTIAPGPVGVALPLLASTATLHPPGLTPGAVDLTIPLLPSSAALYPPAITTGVTLILPLLGSTATLYAPSISPGPVALTLPLLPSAATLFAPTVSVDAGAAQSLTMPLLASTASLYAPTVALIAVGVGPQVTGAVVNAAGSIVVAFDRVVSSADPLPGWSATGDGDAITFTAATISGDGRSLTLTPSAPILASVDTVLLSYAPD